LAAKCSFRGPLALPASSARSYRLNA